MTRRFAYVLPLLAVLAIAGCGGEKKPAPKPSVHVYFLRKGFVVPVGRVVAAKTPGAALRALADGPRATEPLTSALPKSFEPDVKVEGGVATVESSDGLDDDARAQVVWTLTQFKTVKSVRMATKKYTRVDFVKQMPILII